MKLEIFGWQHIIYLLITLGLTGIGIWATKKYVKNEKTLTIIVKSLAAILFVAICLNRFSQVRSNGYTDWLTFIPSTFCGVSSFLLSLSILFTNKDSAFLHFIIYLAFLGGMLTIFYPTFITSQTTLFVLTTFTGLLHHSLMVALVLLTIITGYFVPNIKRWYALPLGLCAVMTYGLFMYDILGRAGAMTINRDFEGIKGLTWFNVGLMFLFVYAIFIILYTYIKKSLTTKQLQKSLNEKSN